MQRRIKVVMFTDREGSSTGATGLGDETRARINGWQEQFTREIASETRAEVIKFLGDGHLLTFDDALDAIRAGLRLQRRVREHNETCAEVEKLALRIGMDVGSVEVDESGDVRGHAADMAKRVESAGKGQSAPVLFTNRVLDLLPPKSVNYEHTKTITLSGDDRPSSLYLARSCAGEESRAFRNPFIVGAPITNPILFHGRAQELSFAFTRLQGMQSVSIVGERRIGKSSLLHFLRQTVHERLGAMYRPALLDLLHPNLRSVSGVLTEIQRQLGIEHPAESLIPFCERMTRLHEQGVRPLILIDEMEVFIKAAAHFSTDFFDTLRAIGSKSQIAIVTASRSPLRELHDQGALISPLYNIMGTLRLGLFTEEEARGFVQLPRAGVKFTPEQVDEILRRGGRHPLHLQALCFHAAQANHERRSNWSEVWAEAEAEAHAMIEPQQSGRVGS
jgi:class 3 adenylate cyclase